MSLLLWPAMGRQRIGDDAVVDALTALSWAQAWVAVDLVQLAAYRAAEHFDDVVATFMRCPA